MKNFKKLDLVFLCGGKGTRIKKIAKGTPKSLLLLKKNFKILDLLLKGIKKDRLKSIYLSINRKNRKIFENYKQEKRYLKLIIEKQYLGTGGALKYAIKKNNLSNPFFVINGDTFSKASKNLHSFLKFANYKNSVIGISKIKKNNRYGSIKFFKNKIIDFSEKRGKEPWINNGHYLFYKENFKLVKKNIFSLEKELLPILVSLRKLNCKKFDNDKFVDIGTVVAFNKFRKNYYNDKN